MLFIIKIFLGIWQVAVISMASKIVEKVCTAICCITKEDCISTPTAEMWGLISCRFENRAYSPNGIGAVDGKHTRLTCSIHSGSMHFNYKGNYFIVLAAVTGSKYRFMYFNVGSYG